MPEQQYGPFSPARDVASRMKLIGWVIGIAGSLVFWFVLHRPPLRTAIFIGSWGFFAGWFLGYAKGMKLLMD